MIKLKPKIISKSTGIRLRPLIKLKASYLVNKAIAFEYVDENGTVNLEPELLELITETSRLYSLDLTLLANEVITFIEAFAQNPKKMKSNYNKNFITRTATAPYKFYKTGEYVYVMYIGDRIKVGSTSNYVDRMTSLQKSFAHIGKIDKEETLLIKLKPFANKVFLETQIHLAIAEYWKPTISLDGTNGDSEFFESNDTVSNLIVATCKANNDLIELKNDGKAMIKSLKDLNWEMA